MKDKMPAIIQALPWGKMKAGLEKIAKTLRLNVIAKKLKLDSFNWSALKDGFIELVTFKNKSFSFGVLIWIIAIIFVGAAINDIPGKGTKEFLQEQEQSIKTDYSFDKLTKDDVVDHNGMKRRAAKKIASAVKNAIKSDNPSATTKRLLTYGTASDLHSKANGASNIKVRVYMSSVSSDHRSTAYVLVFYKSNGITKQDRALETDINFDLKAQKAVIFSNVEEIK